MNILSVQTCENYVGMGSTNETVYLKKFRDAGNIKKIVNSTTLKFWYTSNEYYFLVIELFEYEESRSFKKTTSNYLLRK